MTAAVFLLPLFCCCQYSGIQLVENKAGLTMPVSASYSTLRSAVSKGRVYFTTRSTRSGITIYTYTPQTGAFDSLEVIKDKKNKALFASDMKALAVSGDYALIITYSDLVVLERDKKKYRTWAVFPNTENFNTAAALGEKFFLHVCYNFAPGDADHDHVWATLDPTNKQLENVTYRSEENTPFGNFVNSWTSVYGNRIAYAESASYKVHIYDDRFRQIDSLSSDELDGNKPYLDELTERELSSKEAVMAMKKLDDSLLIRIRKVWLLDDTSLLVLLKLPNSSVTWLDYWQKSDGRWSKGFREVSTLWYEEGQAYSPEKITHSSFYQNVSGFTYLGNKEFIDIYYPFTPTVTTESFSRSNDFDTLQNQVIQDEKTAFGIKTLRVVPGH